MRDVDDIVIVGGGPAGLSTALFLVARAPELRSRIVVLDKARYPREKPCAGAVGGRGERALARIGVHVDVPSVPIGAMVARMSTGVLAGAHGEIGRVVRRIEYDAALARVARARGIRVEEGVRVTGLVTDEAGVTLQTDGGERRARIVVGADGVGSVVRRALGIPFGRMRAQVVELDTEEVRADFPRDHLVFAFARDFVGYTWDFPTIVDGRALVCRGAYVLYGSKHHEDGPDPDDVLGEHLAGLGLDAAHYKKKRFSERGLSLHEPIARARVLLVGEAAGIDPLLGEGIAQAILYGKLAATYLVRRLAQRRFAFDDWRRAVLSSRLGVDLAGRVMVADAFLGPMRRHIEAYTLGEPAFMRAGLRYFGGHRSLPHFLRAVWGVARYAARASVSSA